MTDLNGHLLMITKKYIIETYGEDKFGQMLEHVSPETKAILSGTIVSKWYDVKVYNEMIYAFDTMFSRKDLKKLGEYSVKKQMSTILGMAARFLSPERVLKTSQIAWNRIYSDGKNEMISCDDTKFIFRVSGVEFNESWKYGYMYYLESMASEMYHKAFIGTFKTIDKTTTEFTIVKLLK
jgi:hypothetical protein